ncbi:MAG TPA: glycosyl hydrolase family 28-related protein [Bryobacteraceae bacterium]|nr:glycosyl hydrolase family 28-related protein [Bryobacteraceae bacterium]
MSRALGQACLAMLYLPWLIASSPLDVHDFGAKGDGATKDTQAIQAAIDKVSSSGGGTVVLPPGKYVSGTIHLRSNLTLQIDQGAVLMFSPDDEDFDPYEELPYHIAAPPQKTESQVSFVSHILPERRRLSAPPAYDDTETTYFHYALLAGDGVHNVAIRGTGAIESNRTRRGGPKPIGIKNSEWISVRGITIRNAPNYNISFAGTDHIEVEGVTLINGFADGVDFDGCRYVRVSNCYIDAWDDAVCPKASWALGKRRATEHLVVANCVLRTSCNHFKFGTESAGDLKDISVTNCVMLKRDKGRKALGGIALESVDGANIDGVVVSNISMEDVISPIFIRLGARGRGMDKPAPGSIRNISIQNVVARRAMLASTITGIDTGRVQNVSIDGFNVTAMGGVAARELNVPEAPAKYPDPDMFGDLPALALYGRHVDGLTLRNVKVHSEEPDGRPAVILDDVARLEITGFDSTSIPPHQPILLFENVAGALLYGNRAPEADVFLSVRGAKSNGISLRGNDVRPARQAIQQSSDVPRQAVSIEAESSSSR